MNIAAALSLLISLAEQAQRVSALIARAHAEGRDTITDADLDAVAGESTAARQTLVDAIERAKAGG